MRPGHLERVRNSLFWGRRAPGDVRRLRCDGMRCDARGGGPGQSGGDNGPFFFI